MKEIVLEFKPTKPLYLPFNMLQKSAILLKPKLIGNIHYLLRCFWSEAGPVVDVDCSPNLKPTIIERSDSQNKRGTQRSQVRERTSLH